MKFIGYRGDQLVAMFVDRDDAERWANQGPGRSLTVEMSELRTFEMGVRAAVDAVRSFGEEPWGDQKQVSVRKAVQVIEELLKR